MWCTNSFDCEVCRKIEVCGETNLIDMARRFIGFNTKTKCGKQVFNMLKIEEEKIVYRLKSSRDIKMGRLGIKICEAYSAMALIELFKDIKNSFFIVTQPLDSLQQLDLFKNTWRDNIIKIYTKKDFKFNITRPKISIDEDTDIFGLSEIESYSNSGNEYYIITELEYKDICYMMDSQIRRLKSSFYTETNEVQ